MVAKKNQDNIDIILSKKSLKPLSDDNSIDKLVFINRTTKVVKGGRLMKFNALVVSGDGSGLVGYGTGKAREVVDARGKATENARKSLIRVHLKEHRTIHHDVKGRAGSGRVLLRTAPTGTGVIAGGPMRAIFEALGVKDIVAKSIGSSNPFNMIMATFDALSKIESPKSIAFRRNLKINDIIKKRQG